MKTVFEIFWRDLKRILKNPVALIVTIGVAIIPAMYAWFNVAASWDPYGNTKNIKVAVVNADKGATDDLVGELNAGKLVMDALHENHDLGWVYEDADGKTLTEDAAVEGVEGSTYYAAIVIPEDFSQDLLSITSGTYNKPDIIYYINEKRNTVVPEITNVGAETLQSQVSEEFISTVSGVVADKLEEIVSNTEDTTNNATSTIASKINEAAATLSDSSDGLSSLTGTINASRDAASSAKGSVSDLQGMLGSSQTTLSQATSQLTSTKNSSVQLQNKISGNLASVNNTLGQVAGKAGTDIATYAGKVATAQGYVGGSLTVMRNVNITVNDAIGEIQQAIAANSDKLTQEQIDTLNNICNELSGKNTELSYTIAELQQISDTIQSNAETMSGQSDEISSNIESRITRLTKNTQNLSDNVFPVLNSSLDAFSTASGNLSGVLSSLNPVLVQAKSILSELDSTLDGANGSVSLIQGSLSDVAGTLDRVATDISTISLAELTDDIDGVIGADAQSVASFMVSPVEINTEVMYEVEKYGSAAAPFYTNLAIWVGGFVLIAIYKQEVDREGLREGIRPHTAYLGRLLLYLLIGQLQAIIVCVGDVVMGIQCVSPVAFVFAGMVQSFVYVNIIFALAVAFKHIGKALAVVIVILQIPGSSGLYPIEMMPDFFRNIEPWLPFTYGIRAMRESIAGFYGNHYAVALLQLLAFVIPSLLLGMAARRRLVNINALFDKRLAATELMVCEQESLETNNYGLRSMVRMLRESSYAEEAKAKAARFEARYPSLCRWGITCLVLIPVGLLVLLFIIEVKDAVLLIWVLSCIILCSALIVIEYMHDNLARKSEIASMSDEQVRSLLDTKLKGGE